MGFQIDEATLGRNAKTVVRDKHTGKRKNLQAESEKAAEEEKKKEEQREKYAAWGKGSVSFSFESPQPFLCVLFVCRDNSALIVLNLSVIVNLNLCLCMNGLSFLQQMHQSNKQKCINFPNIL